MLEVPSMEGGSRRREGVREDEEEEGEELRGRGGEGGRG